MMHEHPARADGGPMVEFDIVFPRPRAYRVWVQLQRGGVVNTVHFDVPLIAQKPEASDLRSLSELNPEP